MDFYTAQDQAHRTTLRLVGLFIAAVLSLIILTVLLIAGLVAAGMPGGLTAANLEQALSAELVLSVGGTVAVLIGLASLFRHLSLSRGGRAIAESLGGRQLQPNTTDPDERRLQNVVEEMAIAAGLPVPPIYILADDSINAFAAGYGPDDAVIGVTEGTLRQLDRDELQGVIGHEFSHVLNGDMRLNTRLMAVLFGILVISLIGRTLLLSRPRAGLARQSGGRGSGAAQIALAGIALMALGYLGLLFGNLIKAAVSRQREYLADASAVQFTRNPAGIAGALRKIGGLQAGSRIQDGRADEMSHMFFGPVSGLGARGLQGAFATHPPLADRIRAIDPSWDGRFTAQPAQARSDASARAAEDDTASPLPARELALITAIQAAAGIGQVQPDDVDQAREVLQSLPAEVREAAHDPFGCRALVYALLLQPDEEIRAVQRMLIETRAEAGVPALVARLTDTVATLQPGQRLPLVQLCMPALKALSPQQYQRFCRLVIELIRADARVHLFEWILHQVLLRELTPHFERRRERSEGREPLSEYPDAIATLLSRLASSAHQEAVDPTDAVARAVAAAAVELELDVTPDLDPDPGLKRLSEAITALRRVHPLQRPALLKACIVAAADANGQIAAQANELLHGLAAALDCPLPPLARTRPPGT